MSRQRKDPIAAAHGYLAMFRGETSTEAVAAAVRFHTQVERQIAFVEAHAKKK